MRYDINWNALSARLHVRRQGFWNQWQLKQVKSLAHLIDLIMRCGRAGGKCASSPSAALSQQRIQEYAGKFEPAWFVLELGQLAAHFVLFLVGDEPRRARQQGELPRQKSARKRPPRGLNNHPLSAVQHKGVVDGSDARLDVLWCVTRKSAPRTGCRQKRQSGPCIDRDGAVVQSCDNLLELLFTNLADCLGVDQNIRPQGSVEFVVGIGHGVAQIGCSVRRIHVVRRHCGRKNLVGFEPVAVINVVDD